MNYDILAIGTSAGGIDAMKVLMPLLDWPLGIPVLVIQHLQPQSTSYLPEILTQLTGIRAVEAEDKMTVEDDRIYTPAPNYHLLMEKDWTLSLNVEERVAYARPSIDVTFETMADAVKDRCIGVILTGANHDGANGLKAIKEAGGYTIVQSSEEAFAREMTDAAIKRAEPDAVLKLSEIAEQVNRLLKSNTDRIYGTEMDSTGEGDRDDGES